MSYLVIFPLNWSSNSFVILKLSNVVKINCLISFFTILFWLLKCTAGKHFCTIPAAGGGRWLAHPEHGSASGFFLITKESFSSTLSPSARSHGAAKLPGFSLWSVNQAFYLSRAKRHVVRSAMIPALHHPTLNTLDFPNDAISNKGGVTTQTHGLFCSNPSPAVLLVVQILWFYFSNLISASLRASIFVAFAPQNKTKTQYPLLG